MITSVKKSNSGGDPILRGFEVLGETDASEVEVLGSKRPFPNAHLLEEASGKQLRAWGLRPVEIHTIRVPVQ